MPNDNEPVKNLFSGFFNFPDSLISKLKKGFPEKFQGLSFGTPTDLEEVMDILTVLSEKSKTAQALLTEVVEIAHPAMKNGIYYELHPPVNFKGKSVSRVLCTGRTNNFFVYRVEAFASGEKFSFSLGIGSIMITESGQQFFCGDKPCLRLVKQ